MRSKSHLFQHAIHMISASAILQKMGNQPSDIQKIKQVLSKDYLTRTEQDIAQIIEYMSCFQYFEKIKAKYNIEFMKQLCKFLYLKTFSSNQEISVNRTTFIILSGRVLVTQEIESQKSKSCFDDIEPQTHSATTEMTFGMSFNEFGLQDVKKSTAITVRQTELACLDFKVILDLNSNIKSNENSEKQLFLKSITYFSQFSENEIKYLSYKLEVIKPQKNETIYRENDCNCDWIYFVFKGEYIITKMDSNNKQHQITRLIEGEMFGEEGFLKYETRQFNVKSLSESTVIFRTSIIDLEKKVWQCESRKILFTLIGQKWIYRVKRYELLSGETVDKDSLQNYLQNLQDLSPSPLSLDLQQKENDCIKREEETEKHDQPKNMMLSSASVILKNHQQAQQILQNLRLCKVKQRKSKQQIKNISLDQQCKVKLADNYPKTAGPEQKRRLLKKIIDPSQVLIKVSSNQSYFPAGSKEELEKKLEIYLQQVSIKDEDIDWGGDCSNRMKEKRDQFYNSLDIYAQHIKYQNQNFIESQSTHTKKLNQEYDQLILLQQQNIKNVFPAEGKHKTDNMLRKDYFLKQLKKMQKRLQVLQMITKGYLTCEFNQYVNEEGEIVDIIEKQTEDEAYEIINGQRQLRFNFVKSSNYKQNQKPKFKNFDEQIVEQREKIKVISEIVAGNLDPEQIPFVKEEYSKQLSMRKKLSESIQIPTLIKSFSQNLRITSATFKSKNEQGAGYFGNAIKLRKMT